MPRLGEYLCGQDADAAEPHTPVLVALNFAGAGAFEFKYYDTRNMTVSDVFQTFTDIIRQPAHDMWVNERYPKELNRLLRVYGALYVVMDSSFESPALDEIDKEQLTWKKEFRHIIVKYYQATGMH